MVEELEPGMLEQGEKPASKPASNLSSVLFMPITFPLTVGGTTFAFGVAASADVGTPVQRGYLTLAAVCYGAVTAITLYLAGRLETRVSLRGALLADRLAGILLTAIAVILLANGFTDLVTSALHGLARTSTLDN
jgi:multiple antibiotic resistance protein